MITQKTPYIVVILLLLAFARMSYAASDDTRYFVKSTSGWWKKSFGVRHNFDNGFSADLTDFQLRVANIFGVEVEPVKKLNVLPDLSQEPVISGKVRAQRVKPAEQVPWGVRGVYNDPLLSKSSGGLGVNIAILDTGVLKTHPDLKNRIKACKDFSGPAAIVDGKCDDKNGHGTHVAGIIAADGGSDGLGIYGMVPEANLFAYKVCSNNGTCWADDIAVALRMAADDGAHIVNMSLGSDNPSQLITDAVNYAVSKKFWLSPQLVMTGLMLGVLITPGLTRMLLLWEPLTKISKFQTGVLGVIIQPQDLMLLKKKIWNLRLRASTSNQLGKMAGMLFLSGTSMATPHVAGLAAKEWQKTL